MENVETLAKKIKVTNMAMLALIKDAGLSHTNVNDAISPEDQKTILDHLKNRRSKESEKKTRLTLGKSSSGAIGTPAGKVIIKRKTTTAATRSIAEQNALDQRASELAKEKAQKREQEKAELEKQKATDQEQKKQAATPKEAAATTKEATAKKEPEKKPDSADKTETKTSTQPKAGETSADKTAKTTRDKVTTPPKKRSKGSRTPQQRPQTPADMVQLNEFVRGRKGIQGESAREPLKSNILSQGFTRPAAAVTREIEIGETILVSELAHLLGIKATVLIKELMKLGTMATINQSVDHETAVLVADELGHKVALRQRQSVEQQLVADGDGEASPRSPVVTVMGHVDHGKTSLLDYIRRTRVVDGESGGITQHIGAYHVQTDKGAVTFLDTPGHAAFTSMRARGALMTDIVVLVVACDDKVMPQTIEAIEHARSADVPIVVALNKIDRPQADPERLINELAAYELVPEDWGGDTQFVKVSATQGEGIDNLLEAILLQSELLELTAQAQGQARATVIESRLDKHRGPVASVLVQQGQLNKGDQILVGSCVGRVRAMHDDQGKVVLSAGPSIPVELLGLNDVPEAGDDLIVVRDEKTARELAQTRFDEKKQQQTTPTAMTIEDAFSNLGQDQKKLNLIIKADTRGSIEAIKHSLEELNNDEARVNLVIAGTGGIAETDIALAQATTARVIGFHVRADNKARQAAENAGIRISYYSVIYELIDDIDNFLHGLLEPVFEENILGTAEVRDVFTASRFGKIAGSMVVEGNIHRSKPIRVIRDNTVIYEGELESLRRFKEDVPQVRSGTECGIGVKGYKDVRVGDRIEVFDRVQVERKKRSQRSSTTT